jgi:hypothetical protein
LEVATFRALAEALTGTPVKELTARDETFLTQILQDDEREIDCSQINELLLLVNKDRIESPFFNRFFQQPCRVSTIRNGVGRFQKMALLRYGNFIYAYRTLSRIRTDEALNKELGAWAMPREDMILRYRRRRGRLIEIEQIPRHDTPLVGYLSAGAIIAEHRRAAFLQNQLPPVEEQGGKDWQEFENEAIADAAGDPAEHVPLRSIIANFRAANQGATVAQFAEHLAVVLQQLAEQSARLDSVRAMGHP